MLGVFEMENWQRESTEFTFKPNKAKNQCEKVASRKQNKARQIKVKSNEKPVYAHDLIIFQQKHGMR